MRGTASQFRAGTDRRIIEGLNREVRRMVGSESVRERMLQQCAQPGGETPEEFGRLIQNEIVKWTKVARAAGLRVE